MSRILVVEKNPEECAAMVQALRYVGLWSEGVPDWSGMLARCLRSPPQVIILPSEPVGVTVHGLARYLHSRPRNHPKIIQRLPGSPKSFPGLADRLKRTMRVDETVPPRAGPEAVVAAVLMLLSQTPRRGGQVGLPVSPEEPRSHPPVPRPVYLP